MKICGIVTEYNPLHNGHKIQMDFSREKSVADIVVCVMSGNFVQRGEPAIFDKWTRAKCALLAGADAVIELPFLSAVQSAEGFAAGSIKVLDAIGANSIGFGCETDDLDSLESLAKTLAKEPRKYKRALKQNLASGVSFPKARMIAALGKDDTELSMPNAILAIEYLKAITKQKSNLLPCIMKRVGQSYHSTDIASTLSSATAIRRAINLGDFDNAYASMPSKSADYISEQLDKGLLPVFANHFDKELLYRLRIGGIDYIKKLHEVSEGLENRIFEAAKTCTTRQALIEKIKTKRYTYTRISRILLYALFGITRDMVQKHNRKKINHIHILGASGKEVMSALSASSSVPLITGKSDYYSSLDLASSDVYALTQNTLPFCGTARDFTQKLIIME